MSTFTNGQLVRHSSGRTLRVYFYGFNSLVCCDPHTGEQVRGFVDQTLVRPLTDGELAAFVEGNWN